MKGETDQYVAIFNQVREKLEAANLLQQNNKWADAVSRAYYAVFHAVSALLMTKNLVFSSHSQVIGSFNREFVKTGIFPLDFAAKMRDLFKLRQLGDYSVAPDIDYEISKKTVADAAEIIDNIKTLLESAGYL